MPVLRVLDFETASLCDLKDAGAWRYSEDVSTEVLCLSYEFGAPRINTWTPQLVGGTSPLLVLINDPEVVFCCFAAFEKAIWRNIMVPVYGFPDIPDSRWHDIQAVAAMKALPIDLDTLTIALDLPGKDMEGSKLTISLSKLDKHGNYLVKRTPEVMQRVYDYCEKDVADERRVHDRLGLLQSGERTVWLLDQKINQRGIRIDQDYVRACMKIVEGATVPLAAEFAALTGGLRFTQIAKVTAWSGLPDLSKETVARALGKDIDNADNDGGAFDAVGVDKDGTDLPEHIRRALEIRQLIGSASIKKLPRMQSCVCADGRARGILQYCGTNSGRWSGRLLQPQNFPRPTYKDGDDELISQELLVDTLMTGDWRWVEAMIGPAVEVVVNGLRHALIADKGRCFISGDYVQVELRGLMAHAGQDDIVAQLEAGKMPYQDLAARVYKRPIDKKKDPVEYDMGKHGVLGLGYQMGWETFQHRYAPDKDQEFCEDVVGIYRHDMAPRVPALWAGFGEASLEAVMTKHPTEHAGIEFKMEGEFLTVRLLSGRKLYFFEPSHYMQEMRWSTKEKPDIRRQWRYIAVKNGLLKDVNAFGGMLTGIITQGNARDLLAYAMIKLEANGFPVILTVHDEIVGEPTLDNADEKAFAQIMTERPEWAKAIKFPVKVETWVNDRYKK
jgi:DNA polymerase